MSTFTAALVELAPRSRRSSVRPSAAPHPSAASRIGAFLTGLAVQFVPQPTTLVFVTLALLFAAGILVIVASPETVGAPPWSGPRRSSRGC